MLPDHRQRKTLPGYCRLGELCTGSWHHQDCYLLGRSQRLESSTASRRPGIHLHSSSTSFRWMLATIPSLSRRCKTKLTTEDQQLLNQETDELKLRYLVMISFEEQDVKNMINEVLKEGKHAKNQDRVALRTARAWDKIVACMTWTKQRGECKLAV